jgi:hypothetical protein
MKKTNNDNFIKQFGIYAGVTLLFTVLAIGSVTINWGLGDSQQMFILVNLVMALGFMGYLRMSDYRFDPGTRITDRKTLYWVCLWIALVVLSAFYRPDLGWSNNIPLNVWLLIETLLIASSEEIVFRAFGDWCFPVKGVREEAVMIICYTVFYSYCFTGETVAGVMAMLLSLGTGFLFTGLYLRFRKLGANILYHFLLIYLSRVTAINSTAQDTVLGNAATFVFAVGVLGMIWSGMRLLNAYNREGVYIGEDAEDKVDFAKAFTESRDKYREKVINKAQPSIDKRNERKVEKLRARAEKQAAKQKEKEERK